MSFVLTKASFLQFSPNPETGDSNGATSRKIEQSNVGHRMLVNMGWEPGTGLGFSRAGISEPVFLTSQTDKKGFGFCSDRKLSTNSSNVT